jgi:hypothetical protein
MEAASAPEINTTKSYQILNTKFSTQINILFSQPSEKLQTIYADLLQLTCSLPGSLLHPVCFLPGTTATIHSVLLTMPCVIPPRHYHYTAHTSLCHLFTISCVFPPRHYHYTAHCCLCSLSTVSYLFPLRHYPYTPVCADYYALSDSYQALPLLSRLCCLLCQVCFLAGTTLKLQSLLSVYYALCVFPQALTLHWNLCWVLSMSCVFPPRHYHYTAGCA